MNSLKAFSGVKPLAMAVITSLALNNDVGSPPMPGGWARLITTVPSLLLMSSLTPSSLSSLVLTDPLSPIKTPTRSLGTLTTNEACVISLSAQRINLPSLSFQE
ncbi:MAG: hypothetical protein QW801_09465 [Candidatus Caldarchaeum sp.]